MKNDLERFFNGISKLQNFTNLSVYHGIQNSDTHKRNEVYEDEITPVYVYGPVGWIPPQIRSCRTINCHILLLPPLTLDRRLPKSGYVVQRRNAYDPDNIKPSASIGTQRSHFQRMTHSHEAF